MMADHTHTSWKCTKKSIIKHVETRWKNESEEWRTSLSSIWIENKTKYWKQISARLLANTRRLGMSTAKCVCIGLTSSWGSPLYRQIFKQEREQLCRTLIQGILAILAKMEPQSHSLTTFSYDLRKWWFKNSISFLSVRLNCSSGQRSDLLPHVNDFTYLSCSGGGGWCLQWLSCLTS